MAALPLYQYFFYVQKFTQEESRVPNETTGEDDIILKKVPKQVKRFACLMKPTRRQLESAQLYYSAAVSEGLRAGLMSRNLLEKRLLNDGGILSDEQKTDEQKAYEELTGKEAELYSLQMASAGEEDQAKNKEKMDKLKVEVVLLRRRIQAWEMDKSQIFDITAESRAKNKTMVWWLLNLTNVQDSKSEELKWLPLFPGKNEEEKLAAYDALTDNTESLSTEEKSFYANVISRALVALSFWYNGYAVEQKDFENIEEKMEEESKIIEQYRSKAKKDAEESVKTEIKDPAE